MLSDCEWPRLTDTVESIRVLPIYVITSTALSLGIVEAETKRLSSELGQLGMLVVDADGLTGIDRQHDLTGGMRRLMKLAQEHDTSMLFFNTTPTSENESAGER